MAFFAINTMYSAKGSVASGAEAVKSIDNLPVRSITVKPGPQSSVGLSSASKLATIVVVEPLRVVKSQRKSQSFPGGFNKPFSLPRTAAIQDLALLKPPRVNHAGSPPPGKKQADQWRLEDVEDVEDVEKISSKKEKPDCFVENIEDQSFDCSGSAPYKP